MKLILSLLVISLLVWSVSAQCGPDKSKPYPPGSTVCPPGPPPGGAPPTTGGGGGGSGSSNNCPSSSINIQCQLNGSSNYHVTQLSYDRSKGLFSGSITSNQCPEHPYGTTLGSMSGAHGSSASCITQQFPDSRFASAALQNQPVAAPLRGRVGLSLSGGVNIYNALEAGFSAGQACIRGYGSCPAGVDLATCESELEQECGTRNVNYGMLLDTCSGHAIPYHYHMDLACNYAKDQVGGGHAPLVGIALDGRGIYGLWEKDGKAPTDLDACNGHWGPVPARTIDGVTYPAADWVYHYHTSEDAPYTLGCYGPVTSLEQCMALYPTCNTGFSDICTSKGAIHYDTDCPCFRHMPSNATYNQQFSATDSCYPCVGDCAGTKLSPTRSVAAPSVQLPYKQQ